MAIRIGTLAVLLFTPTLATVSWVSSAEERIQEMETESEPDSKVAVATAANEDYCTPSLKKILRRVLQSCGLLGSGEVRGCRPVDAKNVATMSGSDFNALFLPMVDRGGIVQFEQGEAELDATDRDLIEELFADQRGASYFFVVARASPEGSVKINRELSESRAKAVMTHLRDTFDDPDIDREVGLLWLGEEFAQLDEEFCDWRRSGESSECKPEHINRSAFIAWIDCRL